MNGTALWCACAAVAVLGLANIVYVVLPRLTTGNPLLGAAMVPWMLLIMALSAVLVWILKRTVEGIRNRQFSTRWEPALTQFMKEQRAALPRAGRKATATPS